MRYNYREGVTHDKKRPTWIIWVIIIIALAAGAYWVANTVAPQLISMPLSDKATPDATMQKVQATSPGAQPHLYLPQLNVDLPIAFEEQDAAGATTAKRQGEDVKPGEEGVLAVCAQRYTLGTTPWESREMSPFYNLDKLQSGDEFYLDFDNERYAYKVREVKAVTSDITTDAEPEEKLVTLYACGQDGEAEPFVAVEAEQVGIVASEKSKQEDSGSSWQ